MELKIDPRFQKLLPSLTSEERSGLRDSIKVDGCREPITVWRGVIVDGHNRYTICRELGKPFKVREAEFADADAAMDWIDANQIARRNLTPDAFKLALGRRYNRQKTVGHGFGSAGQLEPQNTATRLASEHGVSEATVKRAGKFAQEVEADPALQDAIRQRKPVSKAKKEIKAERDKRDLEDAQKKVTAEKRKSIEAVCDIRVCSCKELFASGIKPDAVITDPPYPHEFLSVFTELAEGCKAARVPLVAVMSGQSYLPEVLRRLCEHLRYRWTLAYMTPGGQAVQQWREKVNTSWKPVLLFGDSSEWFGDVAVSKPNDNDKRFHGWGQSESGMADLVNRLTKPGQLICDPFLGGGTTAVVSLALGRRFVGCDIESEHVQQSRARVAT